jgi:tetratricopeptide (TPR) repeat protein
LKRLLQIAFAILTLGAPLLSAPVKANNDELNALFESLKAAPDTASAEKTAASIKSLWMRSGSATADLLMDRADTAIGNQDFPLAIELLDRLVVLYPDWAEGWNQRATVFFLMDDQQRAMSDIAETLRREPRHYGAIAGMGLIFMQRGDKKHAFDAFERVLDLYPRLESAKKAVEHLRIDVEGTQL